MSAVNNELALFHATPQEHAVSEVKWITHCNQGQLSKNSPIHFEVSGTSAAYILLSKSRLYLKLRILKEDGSIPADGEKVALTNLSLHSLFRQVDVSLNQQLITSTVGVNYPYKAMLDVLLNYEHAIKESQLQAEGFYKDIAG